MSTKTKQSTSSQSNSATTNAPIDWAAPNYRQGAADALSAYNSGIGSQVYQGQRVPVSLSPQTQAGQQRLNAAANSFAGQTPQSAANLADLAKGGANNPYFQQALNNQLSNVSADVNNQAAAQGMGSSAQQQQLATTMGQTAAQALANQYNTGIGQQIEANKTIDDQLQNYARTKGALAQGQIQAGMLDTGLQQAQLQAAQQKFNEEQMAPWKQLGLLAAGTNSFAAPYGTATSQGQQSAQGTARIGGMGQSMAALGGLATGLGGLAAAPLTAGGQTLAQLAMGGL